MSWDQPSVLITIAVMLIGALHYWSRWTLARELDVPKLMEQLRGLEEKVRRNETGIARLDTAVAERIRVDHDLGEKISGLPMSLRAWFPSMDEFNYNFKDSVKDRTKLWEAVAEIKNEQKEIWKALQKRNGHA